MEFNILDHGHIKLVETWGSDERIIEAARMSTNKGFNGFGPLCIDCTPSSAQDLMIPNVDNDLSCTKCGCGGLMWSGDEKLLRYLYENKHHTPFEMAGMTVEVQAPIMVFREWHRHRTQSYNEMSARYTPIPDVNYKPSLERCLMVQGKNKQAGKAAGAGEPTHEDVFQWLDQLHRLYVYAQLVYEEGLQAGIPKELARLPMPVGRFSRMRASANLRNWLGFMTLRSAPNAQWEIRQYSNAVGKFVEQSFPRTWGLFAEGKEKS